jgi:microcystin degradation protein MlrC
MYSSIRSKCKKFLILISFLLSCSQHNKPEFRILTGGIRHESNTFCSILTGEKDFSVERGQEVLIDKEWVNILEEANVEIIPTLHAGAQPFGVVKKEVYEKFRDEILEGARKAGTIHGIFLDMHGALHVDGYPDAQLDLISRLRDIVGDVLIAASFDLHGNISAEFAQQLDILSAYRTAPHIDGAETRVRTVKLLVEALKNGYKPSTLHLNIPILIPGEKGITAVEPLKTLYGQIEEISKKPGLLDASIFCGMPWTDVQRAGMSAQVVAQDPAYIQLAQDELNILAMNIWKNRKRLRFDVPAMDIDAAIEAALKRPESTVFITDSGDNITAGAAGDMTLVLDRLLDHHVEDAVFAGVVDPEAVEACEKAGLNTDVELKIGGKLDDVFGKPYKINGTVRFLSPESEQDTYKRAAIVKVENVLLVLLSSRRSFTSPQDFADVGIDPLSHKIVVTKLGYLFAGLREIAPYTIMALTPGFANQVIENLEYNNITKPVYPLISDMKWNPASEDIQ